MLNISPFSYGLLIQQVYDNGSVYSPEVLDITEASLHGRFLEVSELSSFHNGGFIKAPFLSCDIGITGCFSSQGVRNIASVCLEIGYPTLASVPHSIINGYKKVLAVAVETDYSFPLAEKVHKLNQNEMFCAQATN